MCVLVMKAGEGEEWWSKRGTSLTFSSFLKNSNSIKNRLSYITKKFVQLIFPFFLIVSKILCNPSGTGIEKQGTVGTSNNLAA